MKKILAAVLLGLAGWTAGAQTNTLTIAGGATNSTAAPADFFGLGVTASTLYNAVLNSGITEATNWAVAPYMTYANAAKDHVGGGVLAVYNVPALTSTNVGAVGLALGMDWLGNWSLVSGNVTLKAVTHPLANLSWLTVLPASVRNVECEPFALAGIGTPLSGGNQGAAEIWDIGYDVQFGHWAGGRFGAGFSWGEWMNAGVESGHRYHFFLEYRKGF